MSVEIETTALLMLTIGWPALVYGLVSLHRLSAAGKAQAAAWPSYWLVAIAIALAPMVFALVFTLFPGLRPGVPALFAADPAPEAVQLAAKDSAFVLDAPREAKAPPVWQSLWSAAQPYILPLLLAVYALGVAFTGLRLALGHLRVAGIVRRARTARWKALGRSEVPICLTTESNTAFAWALPGAPDRAIIVPQSLVTSLAPEKLTGIIDHEAAHLRRRDPETGLVLSVISVIFWFNPFVYGLIAQWRLAAELSCDAAALDGASPEMRKAYAQALIDALRVPAGGALPCPSAAFSTTKLKDEKMRLKRILKGNAMSVVGMREKIAFGACAGLMALAGCAGAATMSGDTRAEAPRQVVYASNDQESNEAAPQPVAPPEATPALHPEPAPEPNTVRRTIGVNSENGVSLIRDRDSEDWNQVITYADGRTVVRKWDDLSDEEKAAIMEDMARAEEDMARVRVEMERARQEMDRARVEIDQARIQIEAERGLSAEERAEIERKLAEAKEELALARAEMERDLEDLEIDREEIRRDIESRLHEETDEE